MHRTLPVLCAALLALPATAFAAGGASSLTIRIEKVSPRGGDVRVALYDRDSYPDDNAQPVAGAVAPAAAPETVVTLSGLRSGVYAIKLFQDFNRNGRFDLSWIGMPLEKYGFSNDARPFLSEPGFDRTRFTLAPGANTIVIHLQ